MCDSGHDSYQPGDLVYYVEKDVMALCRVRKVTSDNAGWTHYRLQIIAEPQNHETYKPLATRNPFLALYNRFTLSCGPAYSPYGGRLYSPEQFETYYGHFQGQMAPWSSALTVALSLAIMIGCLLIIAAYFVLSRR